MDYNYSMKFITLGDTGVGKSSLLNYYINNNIDNISTTIGVDYYVKYIKYDNNIIKLLIWDTAGQERFKSITKTYIRNVSCIILMYDISNINSFINLKEWLNFLNKYNQKDSIIILVGNKSDNNNNREITFDEGKEYAKNNNFLFYETNVINGENINEIFEKTILNIFKNLNINKYLIKNKNNQLINKEKKYRYGYYNCCT
jgi:small GTP-binding protein